jgi:hypothetical protein
MPSFRHTVDIAATPDEVWAVLGDLTAVDRWIPGVSSVVRTDTGRVCTFGDGHVQNEQILDYSPPTRSYRYVVDGAPLPVRTGSRVRRHVVPQSTLDFRVLVLQSDGRVDPARPDLPGRTGRLGRVTVGTGWRGQHGPPPPHPADGPSRPVGRFS